MEQDAVLFIGGGRYSQPLDPTSEKKFSVMAALGSISVIAFSTDSRPRCFTQHAHFHLLPNLRFPVIKYVLLAIAGPVLALRCILRHNVQILVAQSPHDGCVAAIAKGLARLFGRRVALVVENHGDFENSVFIQRHVRLPGLYRLLMGKTARFALRRADGFRCISGSTRQQLEPWLQGRPMVQYPTWTDVQVFLNAGTRVQRGEAESIVLYVGVLIPRKGLHVLLDAFHDVVAEAPTTELWLIGSAENPEYTASLKQQVSRLGLEQRVRFMEPTSQRQLAEQMARATMMVLPSLSEGLGRVVFEAMACGTPVIGSHVGGIPDMICDGETGFLVPPGDVKSLADRIRWILKNPEEARKMGQDARAFAQEFFSPEGYVQNYARLFEELTVDWHAVAR